MSKKTRPPRPMPLKFPELIWSKEGLLPVLEVTIRLNSNCEIEDLQMERIEGYSEAAAMVAFKLGSMISREQAAESAAGPAAQHRRDG